MFERFTDRSRAVLVTAQEEARLRQHGFIGTEHLLLGLIHEREGIAAQVLQQLGISEAAVREQVTEVLGTPSAGPHVSAPFTPRAKKVLELALREAQQLGHNYIGTEHLLLGIVREREGVAAQVLVSLGADLTRVRQQVIRVLAEHQGEVPSAEASLFVPRSRAARAGLVTCSFCGRRPPESGRLVSGSDAFICEHCIRRWSGRLEGTVNHGWRSVASPGREVPSPGPPPEDPEGARSEIAAAFAGHGTPSEDGRSVPMVEGGDALGPVLAAAMEHRRDVVPPTATVTVSVDDVVFVDPTHAAVWFSISVDGRAMLQRHRGDAVVVDGAWKMARSTFCGLMAMAGVPCPPETD